MRLPGISDLCSSLQPCSLRSSSRRRRGQKRDRRRAYATGCFTDAQLAFVPARRADGLPGCGRPLPPSQSCAASYHSSLLNLQRWWQRLLARRSRARALVRARHQTRCRISRAAGPTGLADCLLRWRRSRYSTAWQPAVVAAGPCVGRCRGRPRRCGQGRASRRSAATKSAAATRALSLVCSPAPPSTPLPQVALHVAAAQPRAAVSCDEGRRRGLAHGRGWGLGLHT